MSERALRRAINKNEQEEAHLFQEAVDKISASQGLRFLLARFFSECGIDQSPFSADPLTTARNCGMLEAAQSLRNTIETLDPNLYNILIAETKEHDRSITGKLDRLSHGGDDADT